MIESIQFVNFKALRNCTLPLGPFTLLLGPNGSGKSTVHSYGEKRPPVQVIATTHSPYLLDLYRDHPEEVVLAEKVGLEVQFERLTDINHFQEILGDAPLSEIWYSGVLGGVSVKP